MIRFTEFLADSQLIAKDVIVGQPDFWLTKLNDFNGNFVNAEMVKAFLDSIEYRQRF